MIINFTIYGNQEDQTGNAIPKLKMTGGQHWTPQAKRYVEWKNYIIKSFIGHLHQRGEEAAVELANTTILHQDKPIIVFNNQKPRMDIKIFWKNGKHADAENVFGSIADALFVSDKELDGSFESHKAEDGKGRVEVEITII